MILLACLMLDKVTRQEKFKTWPLHLTLVPWFEISGQKLSVFLKNTELLGKGMPRVTLRVAGLDHFGPRKLRVTLIEPSDALVNLHYKLLDIIQECDAKLINSNHIKQNYKPHVTNRGRRGPSRKQIICRQLHLVARCEDGERQVVGIIKFAQN